MQDLPTQELLLEAVTAARNGFPPEGELAGRISQGGADVLLEDLDLDSLAIMEFCISVELNSGLELTPAQLDQCETLADVAARIEVLLAR